MSGRAFTISAEDLIKASLDALLGRIKDLGMEVGGDMIGKLTIFMESNDARIPESQEAFDESIRTMKNLPKEAIEGMFSTVAAYFRKSTQASADDIESLD